MGGVGASAELEELSLGGGAGEWEHAMNKAKKHDSAISEKRRIGMNTSVSILLGIAFCSDVQSEIVIPQRPVLARGICSSGRMRTADPSPSASSGSG
jgi:hypothetical protein